MPLLKHLLQALPYLVGLKAGDRVIAEWFETSPSIKGDKGEKGKRVQMVKTDIHHKRVLTTTRMLTKPRWFPLCWLHYLFLWEGEVEFPYELQV